MITDKIRSKLATWKGTVLSIMGRVQLVKSIIHGMLVYSFHVYFWPKRLLRLLDSWLKNFIIWSGDVLSKKVCTVSWKLMCRPWSEGGLDLKPTRLVNEALILKLAWDMLANDTQWTRLFKKRYFSKGKPISHHVKSSVWSGIKTQIVTALDNSLWIVGTGEKIQFWTDNWLGEPLVDLLHFDPGPHDSLKGTVSEVIVNGSWVLPTDITDYGNIKDRLAAIVLPSGPLPDVMVWTHSPDGILSSKLALSFLRPRTPVLPWADQIWRPSILPAHSCIYWRFHHGKMPTDESLRSRGSIVVSVCSLCLLADETSDHLFLRCPFASQLWNWIGGKLCCVIDRSSVDSILSC
jgi:hypothetical protein